MDKTNLIKFTFYGNSVQDLLNQMKENKILPKDFVYFNIELNFDRCYYENDIPSICIEEGWEHYLKRRKDCEN